MPESKQRPASRRRPVSAEARQERKFRVLTKDKSSVTRSISDAVVIKAENLYFLCEQNGDVPLGGTHGFGFYYHDCRYINGYELRLAGTKPTSLVATAGEGFKAVLQLSNEDIRKGERLLVRKEDIGVHWERSLDADKISLHDSIAVRSYALDDLRLQLSLTFEPGFDDVFSVRGLLNEKPGEMKKPSWRHDELRFEYDGADGVRRTATMRFSPAPDSTDGCSARFDLKLRPGKVEEIRVSIQLHEQTSKRAEHDRAHSFRDLTALNQQQRAHRKAWLDQHARITTDDLMLNRTLDRSFADLHMLRSNLAGDEYFAAGVPWFTTLFGRDSLTTAIQTLVYDPRIAAQTLRLLAQHQGKKVDDWREEQPGKVLHELRVGELAALDEVPYTPYYGTVDATLLFLILVALYVDWTGDLELVKELCKSIDAAVRWMREYGDQDGDGYIDYKSASGKGLINQGWKDSGDAIVNSDGSLARPPIALVEVQGYAFMAQTQLAAVFERMGEKDAAARLRSDADDLRKRFNRDFWLADKGVYALALQKDGERCAVVSSNPGQALWTGICDEDKARATTERLFNQDMFNGWGVRTLATGERRYNPNSYHLGSVWPHDNSIIAAGLRHAGYDDRAQQVFEGILGAATYFDHYRLPELFAGFTRKEYGVPVRYPVACHPQAWAAGSVPFLLTTALGLQPKALDGCLRIVRPMLPARVRQVTIERMTVGKASIDLRFERGDKGEVRTEVQSLDGKLDVQVS